MRSILSFLGCVGVIADEIDPARVAALRLGVDESMTAFTVQINCGSGMQSIDTAYRYIQRGTADLVLAGGTDSLSHSPLVYRRSAVEWFAALAGARSAVDRIKAFASLRPSMFKPVIGLERGLTDPVVELNMGQTAEVVAHVFNISRRDADQYAVESQLKLARAQADGHFAGELEPAFARNGKVYDLDDGVRPDTSVESLAKLKPAFERPWGKVTPGNSSQITDGASWIILASEARRQAAWSQAARRDRRQRVVGARSFHHGARPGAVLERAAQAPCAQSQRYRAMGAERKHPRLQVLGCLAAWQDDQFCREGCCIFLVLLARSIAASSMSTAARSGSVIRSAPAATASCCIWSMR